MDRLLPNQSLEVGDQLVSKNGWLKLVLQRDGNLALYRVQTDVALWASNTGGRAATKLSMQGDGNLVLSSVGGAAFWASGTEGHAGASVVLQDDGNLVVLDATARPIWATNTVQSFDTPTIGSVDGAGLSYVETSEAWKKLCQFLPCFTALQWPGYATSVLDGDPIDGQPVVIQLWKGWCQKFLGLHSFPGGIGAEVGIYRRIPGKLKPTSLPFLPAPLEAFVLGHIANLRDDELWWPAPELNARLEFSLINPVLDQPMFSTGPETSYWLTKWMDERSYVKYVLQSGGKVPVLPDRYILEYKINGRTRRWPTAGA